MFDRNSSLICFDVSRNEGTHIFLELLFLEKFCFQIITVLLNFLEGVILENEVLWST